MPDDPDLALLATRRLLPIANGAPCAIGTTAQCANY
jgi:hypothetical protein